jgi:hypothetical protein
MKLNQVIAIEKDVKARAGSVLTELYHTAKKPEFFNGFTRVHAKKNDDDEDVPSERKLVQFAMPKVLAAIQLAMSGMIDVTAQKDAANMKASAPVIIDGREITPPLPVTTLIMLEKLVTDLRTFFGQIPELDLAENWEANKDTGLFRSDGVSTNRTKKVQKPLVLYEATKEHPAQVQLVGEDVVVGTWTTTKHSGAMRKPDKEALITRAETLLRAVKEAREAANAIDAGTRAPIGAAIFDYLLTA